MTQQTVNLDFLDTPAASPFGKPGPYRTTLTPDEEKDFLDWVKQNKVPLENDTETSDYDMRGFYQALKSGDERAKTGMVGNELHYPDVWKTPYHKTFSNESMYALPGAPHWEGEGDAAKLVPTGDTPDVSVNLDFLTPAETWRGIQAARFPTSKERGGREGEAIIGSQPWSSLISPRAVETLFSDLNPINLVKPLAHPLDFIENVNKSQARGEEIAGKAWSEGDYPLAIGAGMSSMLPFGHVVREMAEEGGVDPATLTGHTAAMYLAPKVYSPETINAVGRTGRALLSPRQLVRDAAETIRRPYRAVKNAAIDAASSNLAPEEQVFKALRPKNTTLGFKMDADANTLRRIGQAADAIGRPVQDIESFDVANEASIHQLIQKQRQLLGANEAAPKANGASVADAIIASVPKLDRLRMGDEAFAQLQNNVRDMWDRDFEIGDIDQFRRDSNSRPNVAGYFNKLPNAQIALDRQLNSAMAMAENTAIRNLEMKSMEDFSGTGGAMRQVNQAIKEHLTVADIVNRRFNVEQRQAIQNLPQQVGKLMALGKFGKAATMIASNPIGAAGEALAGAGEVALADFMRDLNSTNGQIASAFRRLKGTPQPININPVRRYPNALPPARSTVMPSETGIGTPGHPLEAQGWNQPAAMELPQGLREGYDEFMQTGSSAESLPNYTPDGPTMRNLMSAQEYLDRERAAGRLGLQRQGGVPEVVQQTPTIVKARLRPTELPSSGDVHEMPAPVKGLLPEEASPASQWQLERDENGRMLPRGQRSMRDLLNITPEEKEIVDDAGGWSARDPKTGRFVRRDQGSMSINLKEGKTLADLARDVDPANSRVVRDLLSADTISGKGTDMKDSFENWFKKKYPNELDDLHNDREYAIERRKEYRDSIKSAESSKPPTVPGFEWPEGFKLKSKKHPKYGTQYTIDGPGLKKGQTWIGDTDTPENAAAEYFANYATSQERRSVMLKAIRAGWDDGESVHGHTADDFVNRRTLPEYEPKKHAPGKNFDRANVNDWESFTELADQAFQYLLEKKK